MKFIPDKWRVLATSYSTWALMVVGVLTISPDLIYILTGIDTNPAVWSWLLLASVAFGLIGRLIDQVPETALARRLTVCVLIAMTLLLAAPALAMSQQVPETAPATGPPAYEATAKVLVPLVRKWEGKHPCPDNPALHCSYFDRIASPPLWTVGYGHTQSARAGQRLTESQASDLLARDLRIYWADVRQGFSEQTLAGRLTPERDAAYSSLGYNVGPAAVRRSTATRRLNAGEIAGGCDALGWFNKAGGRVVRGLVNRRADEVALCMQGLGAS